MANMNKVQSRDSSTQRNLTSETKEQKCQTATTRKKCSPDCTWSWVIAVACSMLNFFNLALIRSSSVLFLKTIEHYNVTRTEASWPLSLTMIVSNLSGIITGYLTRRFGPRKVAISGAIISSTSVMGCYLASDVRILALLSGVCHGFGLGLILPAVAVCLNVWFDKKKVTASGIIYTGNALGSFFFPFTLGKASEELGLSGGFLILGAIMANSIACALFIRMPPWISSRNKTPNKALKRVATVERFAPDHPLIKSGNFMKRSVSEHSFEPQDEDGTNRFHETMRLHTVEPVEEEIELEEGELGVNQQKEESRIQIRMGDDPLMNARQLSVETQPMKSLVNNVRRSRGESMRSASMFTAVTSGGPVPRPSISSAAAPRNRLRRRSSAISATLSMFEPQVGLAEATDNDFESIVPSEDGKGPGTSPLIYLVGLTFVFLINCNTTFHTVLLDYAEEKGVTSHYGVYILSGNALMDIIGRLSVGLVSDAGHISRPTIIGFACLFFGIALNLFLFTTGFWSILLLSSVVGYSCGTSLVLTTVLVGDYAGLFRTHLNITMVFFNFWGAVCSFAVYVGFSLACTVKNLKNKCAGSPKAA